MTAKDAIRNTAEMDQMIVNAYIGDLDDDDLLIRPAPGMNHIAWQLGHLIASERSFMEMLRPGVSPPLPEGFDAAHSKEAATSDDPAKFLGRAAYQEIWKAQRAASLSVLDSVPDNELGEKKEGLPHWAPTPLSLLNMIGVHPLMHVGQWVAVRRKLGKPIVI